MQKSAIKQTLKDLHLKLFQKLRLSYFSNQIKCIFTTTDMQPLPTYIYIYIYLIHKQMFWCLGGEGVMSKRNWLFPMEIRSRGNSLKWRRIVKYFRKALTPPLPHRAYCAFEITGWWISCHGWSSQSTRGICHIVMWHLCKIFLGLGKIF